MHASPMSPWLRHLLGLVGEAEALLLMQCKPFAMALRLSLHSCPLR
jgi:hypothetical protein